jgi:hypothetical protein
MISPVIANEGWIGASLKEEMDDGGGRYRAESISCMMESCVAVYRLQVDGGMDARLLQQSCYFV